MPIAVIRLTSVSVVPEADIAPAQHYVLIIGDQVVFYEVYAFLNTS